METTCVGVSALLMCGWVGVVMNDERVAKEEGVGRDGG